MAHNIDMSNNRVNFAFTGDRKAIWHGLGQNLTTDASIETWQQEAGMSWSALEADIKYIDSTSNELKEFPNKKILYRDDNGESLAIVGKDYKVVQPAEVLEFFRDLTSDFGMTLSTAGCLFGGTRFWALAETGKSVEPFKGDITKGHLLLVTSLDGSLSNTAKFVATRVVCNNTMTIALSEKSKNVVRQTHHTLWDPAKAKLDLGILDNSWAVFVSNLRSLANKKMSDAQVKQFFKSTFYDPKKEEDEQPTGNTKRVMNLMTLYKSGAGAEYDYGTALGALNAVTNLFTHGTGRARNSDRKFWSAYFEDKIKNEVMDKLLVV